MKDTKIILIKSKDVFQLQVNLGWGGGIWKLVTSAYVLHYRIQKWHFKPGMSRLMHPMTCCLTLNNPNFSYPTSWSLESRWRLSCRSRRRSRRRSSQRTRTRQQTGEFCSRLWGTDETWNNTIMNKFNEVNEINGVE